MNNIKIISNTALNIYNHDGYLEAKELLNLIKTSNHIPDHPLLNEWFVVKDLLPSQRIIHVGMGFVPALLESMVEFLEGELLND